MQPKQLPDLGLLLALFSYDPLTGSFARRTDCRSSFASDSAFKKWVSEARPSGAGTMRYQRSGDPQGVSVYIHGGHFFVHRLAWKMTHGSDPLGVIDHIDGNPFNNSLDNLRDVPQRVNTQNRKKYKNNKTGYVGVQLSRSKAKWLAQAPYSSEHREAAKKEGRVLVGRKWLGSYDTAELAMDARRRYIAESLPDLRQSQ